MNLKTDLDAFRAEFLEKFPPEKAAVMQLPRDVAAWRSHLHAATHTSGCCLNQPESVQW